MMKKYFSYSFYILCVLFAVVVFSTPLMVEAGLAPMYEDSEKVCSSCECRCQRMCALTNIVEGNESGMKPEKEREEKTEEDSYEPPNRPRPQHPGPHEAGLCKPCGKENLEFVNLYRAQFSLSEVAWNKQLARQACAHSQVMYEHRSMHHSTYGGWENVAYS